MRGQISRSTLASESGQMLMLAVFIFTIVVVMAALVFDTGMALSEKERVQTATDAAALAAALDRAEGASIPAAQATACTYYQRNGYSACPTVNIPPSQGPHSGDENYVEVIGSDRSPTPFITALTGATLFPSARSVAGYITVSSGPCGFCVLSPTAHNALKLNGNGSLTITNAAVGVNSDDPQSIVVSGNAVLTADEINTVGGAEINGNGAAINPTPTTGAGDIVDPFSLIPVPSVSGPYFGAFASAGDQTISPGIYDTITVSNGTLTLDPGTYVIRGLAADPLTGFSMSGQGSITGSGVTLYFACFSYPTPCAANQEGAGLKIAGQGNFQLSSPGSGTYQGVLVFFDRSNTGSLEISGQGQVTFTGAVYAKSADLKNTELTTTSSAGLGSVPVLNSLIVVDTAQIGGNGVSVFYDPDENYPPETDTTTSVALVE